MIESTAAPVIHQTVVALFDDLIDTEHALAALRKAECLADQISLVLRDSDADSGGPTERHGTLARALTASKLESVGDWLRGLASLILPERGTFLVAGPLGTALSSATTSPSLVGTNRVDNLGNAVPAAADSDVNARGLLRTLLEFGFALDAASYLENRVAAGAPMLAVTDSDVKLLTSARQLFADNNAINISMAQTDGRVAKAAISLLATGAESSAGGVVITDAATPLVDVCDHAVRLPESSACKGRVYDSDGVDSGELDALLASTVLDGDETRYVVRYAVIEYGGLLGLARRHVAVPASLMDLEATPVRADVTQSILHGAPRFDPDQTFSRHEETLIHGYFGANPYWETAS
jgi:hypothetical protein